MNTLCEKMIYRRWRPYFSTRYKWLHVLLVAMLMVVGSTQKISAVDYIYNVVNNSGQVVLQTKETAAKTSFTAKMRTPFATDFRYYKTLAEAQADAAYGQAAAGEEHGAVVYAENTTISTMGTLTSDASGQHIYVRYSYNPSSTVTDKGGNILKIDGKASYNMEISGYKGSAKPELTKCYYYDGLDKTISWKYSNTVTDDERLSQAYKWYYIGTKAGYEGSLGHPDPYDIKIVNAAGRIANRNYVVCGPQDKAMPFTPTSGTQHINCTYSEDGANANYIYRFFFRVITGSVPASVQLAAAEPCYIYQKTNSYWFVLNSEEDNDSYKSYMHLRLHNAQEAGTNASNIRANCMFTKQSAGHKYVIVDDSGTPRTACYPTDEEALTEVAEDRPMVPVSLFSPLVGTYTYYTSVADAVAGTNAKTTMTDINAVASDADIYVRYTYNSSNEVLKLDGTTPYNMKLDGYFLKYESSASEDSHVNIGNDSENDNTEYAWTFTGGDPYGIIISNKADATKNITGSSTSGTIALGTGNKSAALQANDSGSASNYTPYRFFLTKSPLWTAEEPHYQLRATYVDEDDRLFTWAYGGRDNSDWNEVRPRMFSSEVMEDTEAYSQMEFDELSDNFITYHVIDKRNEEVTSAQTKKVDLSLPDIIASPLVDTYYYHTTKEHAIANPTTSDVSSTSGHTDIYVTYTVGTDIDISRVEDNQTAGADYGKHTNIDKKKYMIRFLNGSYYYQEDGKDGLTDGVHTSRKEGGDNASLGLLNNKYKAEYAYINGDGNLYIYCDSVHTKQFTNAANERTRWSWYIDGDNNGTGIDPYHVTICAASNASYSTKDKDGKVTGTYYGYFFTYYNTTLGQVITSTISKDPQVTDRFATDVPTEYMLLGKKGKYRLVTTASINGEQRTVNSLEQYFKNYDLIKKNYFYASKTHADTLQWASTDPLSEEQEAELVARGWHKYQAWANSVQWDGWDPAANEGKGKNKSKRVVYEDHWYQTFEVGELFDLIELQTDPAIVLLDNRGWEIMRYTMPTTKGADSDKARTKFIQSYESPMATYHWYKTGNKRPSRHQYQVSDPAMTEDGSKEYTSETLLDFPPDYGLNTGDWYVTYEVKDDYKYLYNATARTSAPVLIRQNYKWAKVASETVIGSDNTVTIDTSKSGNLKITAGEITNDMLWYLSPNANIDREMGFEDASLKYTDDQLLFDPYNIQIQNVGNSKYFKTAATATTLKSGQYWTNIGNHPYTIGLGEPNNNGEFTATGADNVTARITNTTFMALEDAHGNMRLVPRFDHEAAVTNLTSGSPQLRSWVYDIDADNKLIDLSLAANKAKADSVKMQTITFLPIQRYKYHVRDINSAAADPDIATSDEFYAVAGSSMLHTLGNVTAALPDSLIRAYCDYEGAYTTFNTEDNTYSNKVTNYPTGSNGISLTHLYVPYRINANAAFFATEDEAIASTNWMFLVQGLESVAPIFGKRLYDYGKEVAYGMRDASSSENIGSDIEGLTPAEQSFVSDFNSKGGGLHFLRRTSNSDKTTDEMDIDSSTGAMTAPTTGTDDVAYLSRQGEKGRYIASRDSMVNIQLLSPLNDFRRIAETYKENSETGFREGSWLWAFIGNPYKFYIINRETGKSKRLALVKKNSKSVLKLTDAYEANFAADPGQRYFFTMTKYDWQTDEEAETSFALQIWDGDNISANDSVIVRSNSNDNKEPFGTLDKNYKKGFNPDVAYLKVASFMAYPWNWSDTKYQAVTVNIYPGTEESHGPLALTKTYTRADRAFIAGDVIDGTDGHFYLPIEAQEDGSWKPDGVYKNTVPFDNHLINIPYELRRKFCKYTVEGGSFTVEYDDSDNPTPQVLNIYYTIDTEHAPLFVSEDDLSTFRALDDNGAFKGKQKSDYYYFLDQDNGLNKHLMVGNDNKGSSQNNRFNAADPQQLMWFFVGDPYSLRLCNVYTDKQSSSVMRNLVRHRYADASHSTGYSNSTAQTDDNKLFMEDQNQKTFYWEMVEPYISNTGEFSNGSNVKYRKNLLKGTAFAVRMKDIDDGNVLKENATYYYLTNNGQTNGLSIYYKDKNTLNPRMNQLNSFATFPDSRLRANDASATITPLKPAKVYVTVYDPDEPSRKVTDNEESDFYAITDHFKGVPDNLQRNYCDYWWVSTNSDTKSTNMVDEDLYYTVAAPTSHIYARYRETAASPFSKLVDGVPVLKSDASKTPWYNMRIGGRWALFDSGLDGKTKAGDSYNVSVLSFPFAGGDLPNDESRFRKGLQWALIGDPYNFTLRNNRDIISLSEESEPVKVDGENVYNTAWLKDNGISTTATTWTWLRNATTTNDYFLSESSTRRTVPANAVGAKGMNAPRRILPADYDITQAPETRNFSLVGNTGSITTGNNYAKGSYMVLKSVTEANNESFDAIVNVYNKMNELVATTGWTELARSNAKWSGSIPTDVRRWGCTYHYWADETMTRYPFHTFDQTDDGNPKNASNNYLIKDGGTVYVTYDYDESLYSSENEYRWINLFFNWNDEHKVWERKTLTDQTEYTAEYWEYNKTTEQFERRDTHPVTQSIEKWVDRVTYTQTQERWMESPKADHGGFSKDKAYAYYKNGQYTVNADSIKSQKWAMIGDPYKFILYNHNRKAEAGTDNAYYLRCDLGSGNAIASNNFTDFAPYTKSSYPGLYWTWKIDGTRFTFAEGDAENNTTEWVERDGLPEWFYKNYTDATKGGATEEEKKDGLSIETGYLALCDMEAKSQFDKGSLVGSIKGYADFEHKFLQTTELTDGTGDDAPIIYHTGTKEKYHIYKNGDDPEATGYKHLDYTDNTTVVQDEKTFTQLWRETYKKQGDSEDTNGDGIYDNGTYKGYYVGPIGTAKGNDPFGLEQDVYKEYTTYKSVRNYNVASVEATNQYLQLRTTTNPEGDNVPRFLVMPMAAHAKSITFHLDMNKYTDGTVVKSERRSTDNPIFDHTSENYGVGNTLVLPWTMRRQYCDYKFYLIEAADAADNKLATYRTENKIDDLTLEDNQASDKHRLTAEQRATAESSFWKDGEDLSNNTTEGDNFCYDATQNEFVVPESWKDKDIFLRVTYQPTAEFSSILSNDATDAKWLNIVNTENGNMLQYTRTNEVTAAQTDPGEHATNDYLWAVVGDPYGFKLRNRYAVHGFDGTTNQNWTTLLTTNLVNTREHYNYLDGIYEDGEHKGEARNSNFTYNANGDPIMKSGLVYGSKTDANNAYGTMSTTTDNAVYEAMTGNYNGTMLIHPVNATINIRNQNGYKYYGAFLFNGSPTGDPVQLNYMEDWEVMRNVFANWHFVKPTAAQLLPYYNRAGYVGGLKPGIAAAEDNKAIFEKIKAGTKLTTEEHKTAWDLVHNPDNLVQLESGGYYRLKAYSAFDNSVKGSLGGEYVSGYLHKLELDEGGTPLHLYGKMGETRMLTDLDAYSGNEWASGKESRIDIPDTEYDPSSIFHVTRVDDGGNTDDDGDYLKLETQGLVVSDNVMMTEPDAPTAEQTSTMLFQMQDIGQTAFQLRTKEHTSDEQRYLSYNPTNMKYALNAEAKELSVAEGVVGGATVYTHDTKWLLEPVQTGSLTGATVENAAGVTYQHPLRLAMNDMGGDNYFATVCFPYNVKLPTGAYAYSCIESSMRSGEKQQSASGSEYYAVNIYQIAGDDEDSPTVGGVHNRVIPANVPALVYVDGGDIDGTTEVVKTGGKVTNIPFTIVDNSEIQMTAETLAKLQSEDNPLKSQFLTQELTVPDDKRVFVFSKSGNMVGFMRNATPDYTGQKNAKFVLHNKLYYLNDASDGGAGAKFLTLNFMGFDNDAVVVTDLDAVDADMVPVNTSPTVKEGIYDLQGRKLDRIVRSGVYIINGKKVVVRK